MGKRWAAPRLSNKLQFVVFICISSHLLLQSFCELFRWCVYPEQIIQCLSIFICSLLSEYWALSFRVSAAITAMKTPKHTTTENFTGTRSLPREPNHERSCYKCIFCMKVYFSKIKLDDIVWQSFPRVISHIEKIHTINEIKFQFDLRNWKRTSLWPSRILFTREHHFTSASEVHVQWEKRQPIWWYSIERTVGWRNLFKSSVRQRDPMCIDRVIIGDRIY